MIEHYIKILESFKEHQISKLIETIKTKVLATLNGPNFNSRVAPYLKSFNSKGIPFSDFTKEPDSISQIKKLINALYHAHLAFVDLENIDIRKWNRSHSDLELLYNNTIHEAYQASFLLTHLDVDLRGIFTDELNILLPLWDKFEKISASVVTKERTKTIETIEPYPLVYNAGIYSGIAIDQMKPNNGEIDYNYLTHFSAALPSYINALNHQISKYSSQIIAIEPTLDNAQILELKNTAFKLLTDLESISTKNVFTPLKFLKYSHIIRHIITLSTSILEQMGNFSESSQDLIRSNLTILKYTILPTLFGLVDKIEDNAMLKPGTLSNPLMKQINQLYELLIYYASKPVNFYAKGEELLSIEDSRFLELRLELTYKRIDEANKSLIKIEQAQDALDKFFLIVDNPLYQAARVRELPTDIKKELTRHYKMLKPYMMQLNFDLNNALIDSLNSPANLYSYLGKQLLWVTRQVPADHMSHIQAPKESLRVLILKNKESQQFHIQLNEDLIASVQQQTKLAIFPYNGVNVFFIDESEALKPEHGNIKTLVFIKQENGNNVLANEDDNLKRLNSNQALDLYQWYRNKRNKFEVANKAYIEFMKLLPTTDLSKIKTQYNLFQPYFISGITAKNKATALNIDKYLSHILSGKTKDPLAPAMKVFNEFDVHFQKYFSKIDREWGKKSQAYLKLAKERYSQENEAAKLEKDNSLAKRAHHLIQHTDYSQFINEFRKNLYQMIALLNNSMKTELKAESSGLPFPELEDRNKLLAQSKQLLALKRIFNGLYHIEQIVLELEKLDNKQSESRYVYHLLHGYGHIHEIMTLTKNLYADPHFRLIATELLEKAQTAFATLQEHSDAYLVAHEKIADGLSVQKNTIWYVLNAFYISPTHIRTLRYNKYTSAAELNNIHRQAKQATVKIETIINSSNSYFKLFMQTPNMYILYRDLTNKLHEFTSTTHDAVMSNINQIRATVFTPMLIESDHWENKLSLIPGTLSGPLKKLTDEYFKGLVNPLGLNSQSHIALVCDKNPHIQRVKLTNEKMNKAKDQLNRLEKKYENMRSLYQLIEHYWQVTDNHFPGTDKEIQETKEELIRVYKEALPKLAKLRKKLDIKPKANELESDFDDWLNLQTNEYDPKFTDIKALVITCYHYYVGLKATYQMQSNTAQEKLNYLSELAENQAREEHLFIQAYKDTSFDKQMEAYCDQPKGLQYTYKEYRTKLSAYLVTTKSEIINKASDNDDINEKINALLKEKINHFESEHFANYYQLDAVRNALAQFNLYSANTGTLNTHSIFERDEKTKLILNLEEVAETGLLTIEEHIQHISISNRPLEEKTRLLTQLKELANTGPLTIDGLITQIKGSTKYAEEKALLIYKLNDLREEIKLTIDERINYIKANVETERFKVTLLAQVQVDTFSFAFIKQCLFDLLEALHLYTPPRKKLLNNLNASLNNQPNISELSIRYGLFATPPIREYKIPTLPAQAPSAA